MSLKYKHSLPSEIRSLQRKALLRQKIRPRVKGISFNRMIPNLLTMLGLCAGLVAIRSAINGHFDESVIAILIATCFDGLDGRIARLLRATSRFGAEFDSLADFLSFGVAPSFVLYLWALQDTGRYAFVPCVFFSVCMALRLARFNADIDNKEKPKYASNFFTGVPAPAGALVALFPIFLGLEGLKLQWPFLISFAKIPLLTIIILVGTACLLISTLPVWSFKNFKVPSSSVLPLLLGTGIYAATLVADPWGTLAVTGLLYIGLLPFSCRSFLSLKADADKIKKETSTEEDELMKELTN